MKKKYMELIKNLGLFFIANFLPNTLAFFMEPLYTRCLSKADYGVVDLLFNTIQLLLPVFTLQIQDAVLRFALDKAYDKRDVFSVGVRIASGGFIILSAICILLWGSGIMALEPAYFLFFLINYLTGALYNIFSFFCRGIDKVKEITVASVLNMVIIISCNLIFLLYFQWGLYGYFIANSIGTVISAVYIFCSARLWKYIRWHFKNVSTGKEMVCFSMPLIFNSLSWWVNNASDKYVLNFFCGISFVGMYAAAYKIPTILKVCGDVIAMAFSISTIKEFDEQDKDGFLGKSYSMISLFMTLSCSVLMLGNLLLARILFAGVFFEAWKYVPPLLISVLMNQLSFSCENIFVGAKQTKMISKTAVAGAVINTILNFVLIPMFGAYGAGLATAIGFTCFWGLRYYKLKQIIFLKNNFRKESASYGLLVLQAFFAYWGNCFWYVQLLLLLGIMMLYRRELIQVLKGLWDEMRRKIYDTGK